MSNKIKYIIITSAFMTAAFCAFMAAYGFFSATPKITMGDVELEGGLTETESPAQAGDEEEKAEIETETAEASAIADKIDENTVIVYQYYYEDEDKTVREEQKAPYALLNLTREQLIERIEGFSVVSFSPKEVVLLKKISRSKSERYIIGIWEGRVAVFHGGSGISYSGLKEVTDTPVASLSPYEQERLKDGVIVEGNAELMKVLEDYGS